MKTLYLILITLLIAGCQKPGSDPYACYTSVPTSNGKPTVLVIGDSISYGYLPTIQSNLPNYDVVHNPCNAFNSRITLTRIDSWLDARPRYEAITFNNGLWDIAAWSYIDGEAYRSNLTQIATKIKAKTDHPLFILTTQVPVGADGRDSTAVTPRNDIAIEVMNNLGIPYVDLYSVSLTITNLQIDPTNVHYEVSGYEILGNTILDILNNLYNIK